MRLYIFTALTPILFNNKLFPEVAIPVTIVFLFELIMVIESSGSSWCLIVVS